MVMSALCGCGEQETPEEELFLLRASVCGKLNSLDPAMNADDRAETVFHAIYENLLRMTDDGEGNAALSPGVAKEYEEVTNYDGTIDYVFTLRGTARWSDGTRVKAKDFVFAWQRLADPATRSPNSEMLSMVQGYDAVRESGDATKLAVRAEGDTTFRVTLNAPCSYFLNDVCTATATMPLRRDAVEENENWATSVAVPCNGPFHIGVWSKEEYLQLRRNRSYYESRAVGPDLIRLYFTETPAEAWELYETERADYVTSPPERVAAELAQAEDFRPLTLRSTTCVLYNHMRDAFSNEHVRRAFDLTLDRTAIAAAAGAETTAAAGLVPYGVVDGAADAAGDFRTVGGALCAVEEEGYPQRCLDAEYEMRVGGYWGGVGFPDATCLYVLGEESRNVTAAVIACWNEKLGVSVVPEGVTRSEFDRRIEAGEYHLAIDTFRVPCGDALSVLKPFAGTDANNSLHYVSKPFDLLIGVVGITRDPSARAAFLHDAESLLLGDAALSPLYFGGTTCVLREGLTGVYHDTRGCSYLNGVRRAEQ